MIKTNNFRKIMTRDRYMVFLQMLHFNYNNVRSDDSL